MNLMSGVITFCFWQLFHFFSIFYPPGFVQERPTHRGSLVSKIKRVREERTELFRNLEHKLQCNRLMWFRGDLEEPVIAWGRGRLETSVRLLRAEVESLRVLLDALEHENRIPSDGGTVAEQHELQ